MEKLNRRQEGLLHGGNINFDNLLLSYFPESGTGIHNLLEQSTLNGARFRLFGGTLIRNLSSDLQILDLRNAARYFSRPKASPAIGRSEKLMKEHPGDLINCLEEGLYDYEELTHIAGQVRDDLDMSVDGISLEELYRNSHSLGLETTLSCSISTPNLTLLKLNDGKSQMTIMQHGNTASYRTPPAMNLDIASADISLDNGKLIAFLTPEMIKLIGVPPHQKVIGWESLQRNLKRRDLVLSRGLRHAFTLKYQDFSVDTLGNVEESDLIKKWLNSLVKRMKKGDPSLTQHRKEIGVAIIGRLISDPGLQMVMHYL